MLANHVGNTSRPLIFPVIPNDAGQFPFAGRVAQLCRRHALGRVHAHVQRCILMVGEPPLCMIQLGRGNAQIQQRTGEGGGTCLLKQPSRIMEVPGQAVEIRILLQPGCCCRHGLRIPVNAVESSFAAACLQNGVAMPAAAQGAIAVNAVGIHGHPLQYFLQQHRFVDKFHAGVSFLLQITSHISPQAASADCEAPLQNTRIRRQG